MEFVIIVLGAFTVVGATFLVVKITRLEQDIEARRREEKRLLALIARQEETVNTVARDVRRAEASIGLVRKAPAP